MVATTYWIKLACCLMVTILFRPAPSELSLRSLRKVPCDVQENSTTNTVVFNCFRRGLRTFPTGITKNVTNLDLGDNKIKNLPLHAFSGMDNLTYLNLNELNKKKSVCIAQGVFVNLTSLRELELQGNNLTYVPDQLPSSLEVLKLTSNKIISLNSTSFLRVKNLTKLYLSKNCHIENPCHEVYYIGDGTFSNLEHLRLLTLSYNNITKVPSRLPVSLEDLELASNRIRYIGKNDFAELKNLVTLKIQGNCPRCYNAPYPCVPCPNGSIEIHPLAFDNLKNLKVLDLAGNSLQTMNSSWFKNLHNLQDLFLSFNFLAHAIVADGGFLSCLDQLKKLDLSFNYDLKAYPQTLKLSQNFSNLLSLKTLHIEGFVFQEITEETLRPLSGLNLSVLNMGTNFIAHSQPKVFNSLQNLKLIYLSENRLAPVVDSSFNRDSASDYIPVFAKPPLWGPDISRKNFIYELSHRLVKPECFDSGRVLDLSKNNLFFISPKQFEGYGNISCLNLSRNGFAAAPNGTEFKLLQELKYLDLSYNKIDLAYDLAFTELQKLEVLDLSYNSHYFLVSGVTHNLKFLERLPVLRVLNMSSNSIFTLTTKMMFSNSLKELQFQENFLGKLWQGGDTYHKLFMNLKNLTYLNIAKNKIKTIPYIVFENLPRTIQKLRLSDNELAHFNWSMLRHLDQLQELELDKNGIYFLSKNLSENTRSLRYLDLSGNKISQLSDGFLQGAFSITTLDLSYNKLNMINGSTFPLSSEHGLKKLLLHGNPFHCTCDILDFILWIEKSDIRIPWLATSVTCSMPELKKGNSVISFDINECNNIQVAFLLYFLSMLIIFCVTFVSIAFHLFYWDASYVWYYLKAKVMGYKYLRSTDTSTVYDAFVTYDTKDPLVSDWVLNHLRVQLEENGEKFLPICLEERDWSPGSPVLDNLTQSIRLSRKTVFVLTEAYVNSGSFKMAVYLAHQRLLDENKDVIVLLLLEPVLQHSQFLRLRRRLCGHSVLEWPKTSSAEAWFWQCLRNAIRVDNQVKYNKIYSRYFSMK